AGCQEFESPRLHRIEKPPATCRGLLLLRRVATDLAHGLRFSAHGRTWIVPVDDAWGEYFT
ncbi:hypothetical protein, partial [Microbacterium sp. UBA3486]|uniref:hypothetical protein n=1 Tax=Microbacterium sp. UBA3486 TaxID=1946947 RepID=UPI0025F1A919